MNTITIKLKYKSLKSYKQKKITNQIGGAKYEMFDMRVEKNMRM